MLLICLDVPGSQHRAGFPDGGKPVGSCPASRRSGPAAAADASTVSSHAGSAAVPARRSGTALPARRRARPEPPLARAAAAPHWPQHGHRPYGNHPECGMSGRGAGEAVPVSSDRPYLNVRIGLRIAGEKTLPRNVRVMGCIVARSGGQVVDAVRAAPGQAGRRSDLYPVCPARELLAGRYARCGTQAPR